MDLSTRAVRNAQDQQADLEDGLAKAVFSEEPTVRQHAFAQHRPSFIGQYNLRWWHPNETQPQIHPRELLQHGPWIQTGIQFEGLGYASCWPERINAWPSPIIFSVHRSSLARPMPSRYRLRDAQHELTSHRPTGEGNQRPPSARFRPWPWEFRGRRESAHACNSHGTPSHSPKGWAPRLKQDPPRLYERLGSQCHTARPLTGQM